MKKQKPIRLELTREEIFEAAFFIGYALARLQSDGAGSLHDRASKILGVLISAETDDEETPPVVIDAMGNEPEVRR